MCDTCRRVVPRLVRAVSRTVTIAVFAGGRSAARRDAQACSQQPSRPVQRPRVHWPAGNRTRGSTRCAGWRQPGAKDGQLFAPPGAGLRRDAIRRSRPARCCCPSWESAYRGSLAWSWCWRRVTRPEITGSFTRLAREPGPARCACCPHRAPDRMINNVGWATARAASRSRWIRAVSTVGLPASRTIHVPTIYLWQHLCAES